MVQDATLTASQILVRKGIEESFEPASAASFKKAKKRLEEHLRKQKKQQEQAAKEAEQENLRKLEEEKRLEEAKKIKLPAPSTESHTIKIRQGVESRGKRVKVSGWVHRIRTQGKDMKFLVLRDGTGYLQCVMTNELCHTYDALTLTVESTITIYGIISELPEGKKV